MTDQEVAFERERRVSEALLKLSKNSTRESQRLQAIKTSWTSKLRGNAIRNHWNKSVDTECGADLIIEDICVPFIPQDKKKKSNYRRACFFVAKIGSMVQDTELFTFGRDVTELKIPTKLQFKNVSPDFTLQLTFYGMDLNLKEKLSSVSPTAKFVKWASTKLSRKDLTGRVQTHILETTDAAPKVPRIYGTIDCRTTSRISVFDEIIHEGFVHLWREGAATWQLVWASIKDGLLKFQVDPRSKSEVVFVMQFTGDMIIKKALKRRPNSLSIKNSRADIVIACQDGEDLMEWMLSSTKHQQHLYKWDRLGIEDVAVDIDDRPLSPQFSSKFIGGGADAKKNKRRSRSADVPTTPKRPATAMESRRRMSQKSAFGSRKRSSSIESPKKNPLATSMPSRPFVTPQFNGIDRPMTFEDLDSPSSLVTLLRIDSEGDSDDNTLNDGEDLAQAYDIGDTTDSFFRKVDDTIQLVPTRNDILVPTRNDIPAAAHLGETEHGISRATPLRTSTKITDPNLRYKYQPSPLEESLSPIKEPTLSPIKDKQPKSLPSVMPPPKLPMKSSGRVVRRIEVPPPMDSGPRSLPVLLANRLQQKNTTKSSASAAKQLQVGKKENITHNDSFKAAVGGKFRLDSYEN